MRQPDKTHGLPPTGVVIPAAGTGSRMGSRLPKQLLEIGGEPLLVKTCRVFWQHPKVNEIVVVVPPAFAPDIEAILQKHCTPAIFGRILLVHGGARRQDSVYLGVKALSPEIEMVLVHDGARPLVDTALISRCLQAAHEYGAAIAALEVKDTLKRVEDGLIRATVDRGNLWQAQTPQTVRRRLLEEAFSAAEHQGLLATDEASLLEELGIPVRIVNGSERNLKITRPGDLELAQILTGGQRPPMNDTIGHGFDAHRLVDGLPLILGGVAIEHHQGLLGHSDADVLSHALGDAILGALGLGDLGRHFPDDDEQYRGVSSLTLLEAIIDKAAAAGYALGNADITVVCQRPRLAPYIKMMKKTLAHTCDCRPEQLNIKATTTEQMGYTGRGEGIAAHAVVLMRAQRAG
ncbi:MAG: bifunctional 2-C-methyl-D-erythritol 4-phosphate cytidylyltransferase/2-C-methyl-D-erythritol 2,4-cyclodiphosphate synthase [Desulfobulbus propionicus]|nr:MAG: bifunctional 2-C-methyl-D-erythritol 4-phosphate cytidylyltransferase/2-C-methyl-D-erythritol 2,4-cyclodiphosphate synthase [Desulfobulbus propionicus]